jgi:hypothetical protein
MPSLLRVPPSHSATFSGARMRRPVLPDSSASLRTRQRKDVRGVQCLVRVVRWHTVAKVDSIGLVVRRSLQSRDKLMRCLSHNGRIVFAIMAITVSILAPWSSGDSLLNSLCLRVPVTVYLTGAVKKNAFALIASARRFRPDVSH